ncbi:MAG: glycosyltransferase [Acidobacteriota bacterium]
MPEEKRVFIFLDTMPQRQGSGASLRHYSNVRAYLDLGFAVEVIQIGTAPENSEPSRDLTPVVWQRVIESAPSPSLFGRLMFRHGSPRRTAVQYYFEKHELTRREVDRRRRHFPKAIYHLEGEAMASIVPWLPRSTRSIWSLHDLPSTVTAATMEIAREVQGRTQTVPERRELHFAKRLERFMADRAPLILCIAKHDADRLRDEWGCNHAEYFPMSIPDDGADRPAGSWLPDGRLRLMHLGRVSHLPSYRSLEYLLARVFPILPPQVLDRISMDVVGRVDEDERTKRILALAACYPNVSFRGFVDDVMPYYENSDLQIVASTDAAGLRTRTIESFAYGLPVLSTAIGARGIAGLSLGEHLLIAEAAPQFVQQLAHLLEAPETLTRLSLNGRDFYRKHQSRKTVASALDGYLRKYFGVPGSE